METHQPNQVGTMVRSKKMTDETRREIWTARCLVLKRAEK